MTIRLVTAGLALLLLVLACPVRSPAADEQNAPPAEAQPAAKFSTDQLDEMVAPVALYPDALLMQVFIASTYPLEVVEADRWRRQQGDLKGDAFDKAVEGEDWDPSVKGLAQFPDVLKRMSDNLDWTKDMGDAFLAQKDDVLGAVQRMRRRAQDAGSLKTSKEQTVTTETVNNKETIVVQPADPQTVYAPQYAPSAVYGSYAPPAPYYPQAYGYTPGQMATTGLLSFGVGVGVGALVSNGCDWGRGDVYVNNHYGGGYGGGYGGNNNVNVNKNFNANQANVAANRQKWQYNPEHRRNVGYRDPGTAKRYGGSVGTTAAQRQDLARGFDRTDAGARAGGRAQPATRPGAAGAGTRASGEMASRGSSGVGAADRQGRAENRGGRDGAFGGYGNGRSTQQVSQRGAASRGGQSFAGGGQRGGGAERGGGGQRGGGGFGGGGGRGGGGGGGGRGGGRRR